MRACSLKLIIQRSCIYALPLCFVCKLLSAVAIFLIVAYFWLVAFLFHLIVIVMYRASWKPLRTLLKFHTLVGSFHRLLGMYPLAYHITFKVVLGTVSYSSFISIERVVWVVRLIWFLLNADLQNHGLIMLLVVPIASFSHFHRRSSKVLYPSQMIAQVKDFFTYPSLLHWKRTPI